jgi:hypothetical protein
MALPLSGPLTLAQIQGEFGGTNPISLSEYYRGGGLVPNASTTASIPTSGAISISNFYGTANRVNVSFTFTANIADASINLSSLSGYVAGISDITITVNNGVYVWASSGSNAGLTFSGGASGDTLTIVNNGYIMGAGGNGNSSFTVGTNGSAAISLSISATINNTNGAAFIGGGGGAGGGYYVNSNNFVAGGGGAGGGNGGPAFGGGGAGGGIGSSGNNGTFTDTGGNYIAGGGGGGRVFPGVGGAQVTYDNPASGGLGGNGGTAGGSGGCAGSNKNGAIFGGAGGSANGTGSNGGPIGLDGFASGGGGGWGALGGTAVNTPGGSGFSLPPTSPGNAVLLNGRSVTWVSGNTTRVYGAVG